METDRHRENLSTADEVVIIILYEAEIVLHRDIIFTERTEDGILQAFSNIYVYHVVYISLVYLLIFLFDNHGYH